MSIFGTNQVEEIFIGNAVAAELTASTFIATASDKELKVVGADGAAIAAGKKFKVLQKTNGGTNLNFEFSDVVDPSNVKAVSLAAYSPEVPKKVTVTGLTGNITVDTTYEVFIRIMEDGGSQSPENFRFLYGSYVTPSSLGAITSASVAASIASDLQKSADSSDPGAFAISVVGAGVDDIEILAKVQPANPAKDPSKPIYFDVQVAAKSNGNNVATGLPTIYSYLVATVNQEAKSGVGTAKYVANAEWFLKGFKYEAYRDTGYPANFNTPYYVDLTKAYNMIHIRYFSERSATNVEKQHKVISIAVEVDPNVVATNAVTNAVLADLSTVLGAANVPAALAVI